MNTKSIVSEFISIIKIIFFVLIFRTLIFEPYKVPTGSMKDTILEGDFIFATKYDYGYGRHSAQPITINAIKGRIIEFNQPKRGDIIVFYVPQKGVRYIKRLIGLPGDTIQFRNDILYINDIPVQRQYDSNFTDRLGNKYRKYIEELPEGVRYHALTLEDNSTNNNRYSNTELFIVPEGKYFFVGDNRHQSLDSRFSLGFVSREDIIGKARFIYFSNPYELFNFDISIIDYPENIWNWLTSIRFNRMFKSLYVN